MFKLIALAVLALICIVSAKPAPQFFAAPVVAHSSQVIARNYNGLAAAYTTAPIAAAYTSPFAAAYTASPFGAAYVSPYAAAYTSPYYF